jgi:hypothetical protein
VPGGNDDDDMRRNAEDSSNNSNNKNLQQQRRSSLPVALLLLAYIVLISGGTSVRRLSRVYELASTTDGSRRQQQQQLFPLHDNEHQVVVVAHDDEDVAELALMMSRAKEKVLEDGLLVMSDGSSSKTNSLASSSCPMEPCGISMLFMGDSLTRFQYISLVYFLRHRRWIDAPATIPHLVRPGDYLAGELSSEWSPWYQASMDLFAPYENCDCYREPRTIDTDYQYICENRYYHDPIRNNTVTYLQALGSAHLMRGHWHAEQAIPQLMEYHRTMNQSEIGDTVGPVNGRVIPYRWQGTWIDAIRGHVADLAPAVLIMNAGRWRHPFLDAPFRDAIVAALQDAGIPRVIWKTTTADRGGKYTDAFNETDAAMCNLLECLDTTWTLDVPSTLYVDWCHFLEPVYRLLNEQLLQQLGIAIPTGVSSVTNVSSISWYPERLAIPGLVRLADGS